MLKNELLRKAQESIEQAVTDKERFARLVSAGTKVIYNEATFKQLAQSVADSKTPVEDVAKGLVAVLNMMAQKARGTIPHQTLLQAGMVLLLDALDFIEQSGLVKIDAQALDTATTEFIEALMPTMGMPGQKLGDLLVMLQQTMSDPQKMQAYQAAQGAK